MRGRKKMKTFKTMFKTEFKLGLRQIDVPIFVFIFPVAVAVIMGLVYGSDNSVMIGKTFASAGTIGIAAMGLMGLPLTLAGYRDAKILKQLKVTPVSGGMILFVQVTVKFVLALISSGLVLLILSLFFGYGIPGNPLVYFTAYALVAFAIFGVGMIIASVSKDANTAGLLCSVAYFPMLIFSGTTVPLEVLPVPVVKILQVLPLTQGINLLETVALGGNISDNLSATVIMTGIGVVSAVIALNTFKWE